MSSNRAWLEILKWGGHDSTQRHLEAYTRGVRVALKPKTCPDLELATRQIEKEVVCSPGEPITGSGKLLGYHRPGAPSHSPHHTTTIRFTDKRRAQTSSKRFPRLACAHSGDVVGLGKI